MRDGVVGCTPETPLSEVAQLMSEYRIHCVVVAGLEEEATGRASCGASCPISTWRVPSPRVRSSPPGRSPRPSRSRPHPADTLAAVARLMGDHDVAHLVVIDAKDAEPIGVISTLDVARAFAEAA